MMKERPFISPPKSAAQKFLLAVGALLIVIWAVWWGYALTMPIPYLPHENKLWMAPFSFVGVDFVHNYVGGRTWVTGGNPYEKMVGDPLFSTYGYAPAVLPFFSWCYFFDPNVNGRLPPPLPRLGANGYLSISTAAVQIWVLAIAGMCVFGAWMVWKFREQQKHLASIPLVYVIGMTVMSTPALLEMERGNCNVLALMLVLAAVLILQKKESWRHDIPAAILLAFAIWIKAYAVFALLAFVAARRYRVTALCVAAAGLIAMVWWNQTMIFVTTLRGAVATYAPDVEVLAHPIIATWPKLMAGTPLAGVPPLAGGFMFIGLPMLAVGFALWRSPRRAEFLLPLTLWCVAAGSYLPHVAYDYNYVSFILVALALWDRRNPFWVHIIMGFLLLWWQPLLVPVPPLAIVWTKVAALYAMGYSLVRYALQPKEPLAEPAKMAA